MILTKYEHACFTLEKDGKVLVVDPGGWTTDLPALDNVAAVVVTHDHPDHFDVNALGAIIGRNPDAVIYAHETITRQFGDTLPAIAVIAGEGIEAGPFRLEFHGGEHAVIHPDMPRAINLGVMINGTLYYPGDSFAQPGVPVEWLALPITAPWLKISEVVDFVRGVKPVHAFPTHDAIASPAGKRLADTMIPGMTDTDYVRLGEPVTIDG